MIWTRDFFHIQFSTKPVKKGKNYYFPIPASCISNGSVDPDLKYDVDYRMAAPPVPNTCKHERIKYHDDMTGLATCVDCNETINTHCNDYLKDE